MVTCVVAAAAAAQAVVLLLVQEVIVGGERRGCERRMQLHVQQRRPLVLWDRHGRRHMVVARNVG